ncbi:MAG: response regulator [Candidatus Omnitrophota bacterium]
METPEKVKILIIDDEEEIRLFLKKNLERQEYSVATAADGEEGLEKVRQSDIEIVFCDIMMPNLNGIDFLKKVRHYHLATQVIMITGKADLETCIEAIEYGACGYLIKPIQTKDVTDLILVAERNIFEEKEMLRKAIEGLKPGEAEDVFRRLSKTGNDVDKKINVIKKTLKKPQK